MGKLCKGPSGKTLNLAGIGVILFLLVGCGANPATRATGINDPFEPQNRKIHAFNKGVDRNLIRPISGGEGGDGRLLRPARQVVGNLGDMLEAPGRILNNLLQGRFENAGHNSFRLMVNATLGVGGLFDPASPMGLPPRDTDFGETLHVWGAEEGAFLSVPILGPSTERDLIGDVIDAAINPLGHILPTEAKLPARAVRVGAKLAERSDFGGTVDDILYNSADSYAQLRLIYLQNRRFELARNARDAGTAAAPTTFADPYGDPYGEAVSQDPYAEAEDPTYIDPYEEFD